jgi:hypothetical protein
MNLAQLNKAYLNFIITILTLSSANCQNLCENAVKIQNGFTGTYDFSSVGAPNMVSQYNLDCQLTQSDFLNFQFQNAQIMVFSYVVENENDRYEIKINQTKTNPNLELNVLIYASCTNIQNQLKFSECIHYERFKHANNSQRRVIFGNQCEQTLKKGQTIYFVVQNNVEKYKPTPPSGFDLRFSLFQDDICKQTNLASDDCKDAPLQCKKHYEGAIYCCYQVDQPQVLTREFCDYTFFNYTENSWMRIIPSQSKVKLTIQNKWVPSFFVLGVFKGQCNNFEKIPSLCDDELMYGVEFKELQNLIPGTEYYVMTARSGGQRPEYSIDFEGIVHSENDVCTDAEPMVCGINQFNGLHCATESDAPSHCSTGQKLGPGLWYSIAGSGEPVTLSTSNPGTNFDAALHVYQGNCASLLCKSGANGQGTSRVTFQSECGEKYYIYVTSKNGTSNGIFELSASCGSFPCPTIVVNGPSAICKNETGQYTQTGGCQNGSWQIQPEDAGNISSSGLFTSSETYSGPVMVKYVIGGCKGEKNAIVSSLGITGTLKAPICGNKNGSILISPLQASYSYSWSNGAAGHHLQNVSDGTYTVTVTDLNNGCQDIKEFELKSVNLSPNAGEDKNTTVCDTLTVPLDMNLVLENQEKGGIWQSIGVAPLPGRFYGVDGTFDVYLHPTGSYSFEYIVKNVCGADTAVVTVYIEKVKNASVVSQKTQCNSATATKSPLLDLTTLITSGDKTGFWTKDVTTPNVGGVIPNMDFTGAAPGNYVYYYNLEGCANVSYPVYVTVESCDCPPILRSNFLTFCEKEAVYNLTSMLSLSNSGNWVITQSPSGSSAFITGDQWNTNGSPAGEYVVEYVLDNPINGCPSKGTFNLKLEKAPNAGESFSIEYCDTLNVAIDLNSLLVGADKNGRWSVFQGSPTMGSFDAISGTLKIKGNQPGLYKFTYKVLGEILCDSDESTVDVIIKKCDCDVDIIINTVMPTCADKEDGKIEIKVTGGTGNYILDWDQNGWDGNTVINDVGSGLYQVSVTDASNCKVVKSIEILSPEALTINCVSYSVTKFNGIDGKCDAIINGGTAPFELVIKGPNQQMIMISTSMSSFVNLPIGDYEISVKDKNGCEALCRFKIENVTCILVNEIQKKDILCHGTANGTIVIKTINGSGKYEYLWSQTPNNGQSNLDNLAAGTYTVTVTDLESNCSIIEKIEIEDALPIVLDCKADDIILPTIYGQIQVEISGGKAPYKIEWNGTSSGSHQILSTQNKYVIASLKSGKYEITVTDINGCTQQCNSIISEKPCSLDIRVEKQDVTCPSMCNGSIALIIDTALTTGINIQWSDPRASKQLQINQLCPGEYSVTVSTQNGCVWSMPKINIAMEDTIYMDIIASKTIANKNEKISLALKTNLPLSLIEGILWIGEDLSCTTCEATEMVVSKASEVKIEVTDKNGCVRTAKIKIETTKNQVYLPNIISSSEGNRYFYVQGQDISKVIYMRIYDRWGNLIFKQQNVAPNTIDHAWNGSEILPGVYIYDIMIEYQDQSKEAVRGDITIIK